MKRFITIFLVFLSLSFNIIKVVPATTNYFKEGVYKAADLNVSLNNIYKIQNVSATNTVYIILFDENQLVIQSVRLEPNSLKYNLLPLKPEYRIVIIGNGEVYIS